MENLQIVDISYDGAGVAKVGAKQSVKAGDKEAGKVGAKESRKVGDKETGKVVFVPKALPGEVVQARLVKENAKFCVAEVVEILRPSAQRQRAFCPHFDVCGGCDFQNVAQEYEKKLKIDILQKELSKVGFDKKIDFVPSAHRKNYRNKLKLEVQNGKIGYFKTKSHNFFEISTCPIASKSLLAALDRVKAFLQEVFQNTTLPQQNFFNCNLLDNLLDDLFNKLFGNLFDNLKNIYLKQAENGVAICFLFNKKCLSQFLANKLEFENFIENCKKTHKNAEIFQIFSDFFVFFAFGEILESDKTQVFPIGHRQKLIKKFGGQLFESDISSFNQINDDVAQKLYDFVVQIANGKKVVNAYSGQGLLTYLLSLKAEKVFGIEYQKSAHRAAEKLLQQHNAKNMKNICGKVEDKLPKLLQKNDIDVVVLDPAREGCKPSVLQEILRCNIQNVVYISCNFATLARDLKILLAHKKYTLESVKIFDMFPCTANMETVAILTKNTNFC